ncbi:Putative aminohydrolase SsnA [Sporomusa carbonis]|uniref:putative aminohydrolase SsnA n=1 Tax=Sporomusa carbonis TaxID=3076075 RepID=UPI003A7270D6
MLLIGNGRLITRDSRQPYFEDGCVVIEDNLVAEVGTTAAMRRKFPGGRFIDARNKVIMPGLINTHMHLYSTFARGLALKDAAPGNFLEILERLWWRLDKALTPDDIYYSAMAPLIDCIKNGTTTIFDHHASPGAVRDSLFSIAEAAMKAGVRSCLCYEVSDRDGVTVTEQGIEENTAFIKYCNQRNDSMVKGLFGLHASFTLSDETLRKCAAAAEGLATGFHVHVAEAPEDVEDCQHKYGKRVVERLHSFGIMGNKTIAAHCVHVSDQELALLKTSQTSVVHNPESNMGNAVGCAPVLDMLAGGVTVGLGTDGYTCDMFESFKVANILHKHHQQNPSVGWAEAAAMLFDHNSTISARHFARPLGKIVSGAYADVIVVDYNPPTPLGAANINSHILFGISGRAVDTTIINGRVVMAEGKLVDLDEEAIMAKARELAVKVWQRF